MTFLTFIFRQTVFTVFINCNFKEVEKKKALKFFNTLGHSVLK